MTWTVSGGGSLSGQTTTAATYNAPASGTAAITATVTATSITDTTKAATLQITVNPLPAITTTSVAEATAGTAYNATLSASGGTVPYTWTVTPTLPTGLTLSSAGVISGTPTGVASSGSFTFKVTDAANVYATQDITVTVNAAPALTVTTTTLPGGEIGTAYTSTQLHATGGVPSYTWALDTGSLPAGLSLSSAGVISGTPTGSSAGTSSFIVTVTDSQTPTHSQGNSSTLSIAITIATLQVTTTTMPAGTGGIAYNHSLTATGGITPYTWVLATGSLPDGLSLSSAGLISGTPTTAATSTFKVQVTDSETSPVTATSTNLSITITITTLQMSPSTLPAATVNTAYSATLTASGGITPYTWAPSGLPTWLTLTPAQNTLTATLSGTPTTVGNTGNFTVSVSDSETPQQVVTNSNLSIQVNATSACTGTLNNSLLNGHYAFMLNGWKSLTKAKSLVGSFVADGAGNITSGTVDVADQNHSAPETDTFTGTYCVGSDSLAQLILDSGGNSVTLEAALDSVSSGVSSNGHIMEYDSDGTLVSGLLRKQDTSAFSTSSITGSYAFGMVGADRSANRFAVAGEISFSGSTITGENDYDDAGTVPSPAPQTIGASDFTVASSGAQAGRGTLTMTSSNGDTNMVVYVVSASELLMMAVDTETPPMIMAGQVLKRSGTTFSNSSMNGVSIMAWEDLDDGNSPATSETQVGFLTTNSTNGTFTADMDDNDGGTITSSPSVSGDYSVDSDGRMTLSNLTGCTGGCGSHNPVFYLVGQNQAFIVGTNHSVNFGMLTPQTGSNFTNTSLSGLFLGGSRAPASWNVNTAVDSLTLDNGTVTGNEYSNDSGGPSTGSIDGTYTVSSKGKAVVSSGGVQQVFVYIISSSQFIVMDAGSGSTNPKLTDFHQ